MFHNIVTVALKGNIQEYRGQVSYSLLYTWGPQKMQDISRSVPLPPTVMHNQHDNYTFVCCFPESALASRQLRICIQTSPLVINNEANSKPSDGNPDVTMLTGHFSWLSFTKGSNRLEFQERLDHAMYPHAVHQPPLDPGQDCMNSLTVPCVLLLGNADVDQAPILPGSMDKSAAVFRMHCLLVGLLRKRHRTEATQKPFKEEKSPDGTSTSALLHSS